MLSRKTNYRIFLCYTIQCYRKKVTRFFDVLYLYNRCIMSKLSVYTQGDVHKAFSSRDFVRNRSSFLALIFVHSNGILNARVLLTTVVSPLIFPYSTYVALPAKCYQLFTCFRRKYTRKL